MRFSTRVCVCPDLYMNFNLGALVFQECCHTRQKWNLWVCGFVSACCVCVFLNMCLYVCVFSYPHLYRRHFAAPLTPCLSFCSPILSHFLPLWQQCGYTYAHFSSHTRAKSHMHTLSQTHNGRSARTQPGFRTYCPLPLCHSSQPPLHGKTRVQFHMLSDTVTVSRCDY